MLNPFAQSLLLDISPKNRGSGMRCEEKRQNTASTTRIANSGAVHILERKIMRVTTSSPRALFDNFFPAVELA